MDNLSTINSVADYEIHLFTNFRVLPIMQGDDGFLYASLVSLCKLFGLNEERESTRLTKYPILAAGLVKALNSDNTGKLCLRLGVIGMWLLNLSHESIEEGDKESLVIFQQNAAQVLEEAFCEGRLTEWPLISELLGKEDPVVDAYKEAVAVMGLARDHLIVEAKSRKILMNEDDPFCYR